MVDHTIARKTQILCSNTPRGRQCFKSRRFIPSIALDIGVRFANGFIVEEREDFVLPDRAANTAAELIELVFVTRDLIALPIKRLIGVQVRLMGCKKQAAVELVASALRCDLNLRAAEPAILRVVAVGDDLYII